MKMFCIYFNKLHALDDLPLQSYAKVIKALAMYEQTGEQATIDDDPVANMALKLLMADVDSISCHNDVASKTTKSQAGKKGAEKRWGKNIENVSCAEVEDSSDQEDESSEDSAEMTDFASESPEKIAEIAENSKDSIAISANSTDSTAIPAIQQPLQQNGTNSIKEKKRKEKNVCIGHPPKGTSADKGRIIPPSQDMVLAYCTEKGYDQRQGVRFYNFYGSKDWHVGKERMKNWHMALANWMSSDSYSPQPKRQEAEDPYSQYTRL